MTQFVFCVLVVFLAALLHHAHDKTTVLFRLLINTTEPIYKVLARPGREWIFRSTSTESGALTPRPRASWFTCGD